jgi:hypothetical protein
MLAVQPLGTPAARLKLAALHPELLRLVTDTVKLAAPPGLIVVWAGESVTVGGVCVHDDV